MEFVDCHCGGEKVISVIDFNLFNIMNIIHLSKKFLVGCLKDQFKVHFFFLLYINDICNVSQLIEIVLCLDDTNVFFRIKNRIML